MHPFAAALDRRDVESAIAQLDETVTFRSPIVFRPYSGRDSVAPIIRAIARVFDDFRYVRELAGPDARDHALVFNARVGARELEGIDLLHVGDSGLVDALVVFVRPLSGAVALAEAMQAMLPAVR